jgi:rhamnose utilization protein RhaD (predicted bifunctional aldolase and dehydrogenase)
MTDPGGDVPAARRSLVRLSHQLGDPASDLAILGEGNASVALPDGTFLVKASGTPLHAVGEGDLVRLDHAAVLATIDDPTLANDDQPGLSAQLRAATRPAGEPAKPPSIETMLHALALRLPGVRAVGHTHPTAVNRLLCSDRAADLVAGCLFPDQVVVCGAQALLVPYAEPGLPLARAVRRGLAEHVDRHGEPPRLVYLSNHGIVALGENPAQVLAVTTMSVKAARILHGALAVGSPRFLDLATVRRLDRREDERHRRRILADALDSEPGHLATAEEAG